MAIISSIEAFSALDDPIVFNECVQYR